jgi:hypothetical protein
VLPRVRKLVDRYPARADPAWSRGDELRLLNLRNENAYSDWLQWLLGARGDAGQLLQRRILGALLPRSAPLPRFELVERETSVRVGHPGHRGRLDIVLEAPRRRHAIVIEAKVRAPNQQELLKQAGYVDSYSERHVGWTMGFSLLVPEVESLAGLDTRGFTPAPWRGVALVLRQLACTGSLSAEPRLEAIAAALCCAVEAKLLGLPIAIWREALSGARLSHASLQLLAASDLIPYLERAHEA